MAGTDRTEGDGFGHGADDDEPLSAWRAEHPDWIAVPTTVVRHRTGPATLRLTEADWPDAAVANDVPPGSPGAGAPRLARPVGWSAESDPVTIFLRVNAGLAEMGLVAGESKQVPTRTNRGEQAEWLKRAAARRPHIERSYPGRVERPSRTSRMASANAALHASETLREFIFQREGGDTAATSHTHWPGEASGVTIGPGYDMRFRTPEQIYSDLTGIGIRSREAHALSAASGLRGPAAKEFAAKHAGDVTLTRAQKLALLNYILPSYEAQVRQSVHAPLNQNEFDALLSFDYSRGIENLLLLAPLIDAGKRAAAAHMLEHFDDIGAAGNKARRQAEAALMRKPASGAPKAREEPLP